jgi:hypothetical protein
MSIYSSNNYRKIYEQHYGPIPLDKTGKSYEIHHIDGNHSNNVITNLKLVTIQEHYEIHKNQEDWAACQAISLRMSITPKERSEISRKTALNRIANGTHPWLNGRAQSKQQLDYVKNGTHHFLDKNAASIRNLKRVNNGTHHLLGGVVQRKTLEAGNHNSQIKASCLYCKRIIAMNVFNRWHGAQCKNILP